MKFDFVIIGAGILGTAIAALAGAEGYRPLVLRLSDEGKPCADTLRNQGWLQSGLIYPIHHFADDDAYRALADRTYLAGLDMLAACGLTLPQMTGILSVTDPARIREINDKAALLRLSTEEFRRLTPAEVSLRLGEKADSNTSYFHIPDRPFDEASVLAQLRRKAVKSGVVFAESSAPATLRRTATHAHVRFDGEEIETPLAVVVTGAGSFELIAQIDENLDGVLRKTPLLVAPAPPDMAGEVLVDLDRGFSAVRHTSEHLAHGAVVIGTKAHEQPAEFSVPHQRRITPEEQNKFLNYLPDDLRMCIAQGRFTAGYEVIPNKSTGLTAYEPWIEDYGPVVFASPGRATIGVDAAYDVMAKIRSAIPPGARPVNGPDIGTERTWSSPISMHYSADYDFNDAQA